MAHVITETDLPYVANAHELEGYLHGDSPVTIIFFDGPVLTG